MIRVTDLKLPLEKYEQLEKALREELMISELHPMTYEVVRRSLDARGRHGEPFYFLYTLDVTLAKEEKIFKKGFSRHKKWELLKEKPVYVPPVISAASSSLRPVVVGLGPAGLFAALLLSRSGLKPLIIERGQRVEERKLSTDRFFALQTLDPESNVQFGEGGAGTFSDGKLNTLIKDPTHRGMFVFQEFVKAGAPYEILYDNKPHVGTDRLQQVIKTMREEILSLGGEIRFNTKLTGIQTVDGALSAVEITNVRDGSKETIPCGTLFLGIGHSARDTFRMLYESGVHMEEKPFAMGLRIEHPREMIDTAMYRGYAHHPALSAASYKLTHTATNGRHVYTFCMCPGGKVIASASEEDGIVTNGMSLYARDDENSNAALLVNILPSDFDPYREEAESVFGSPVLSGALFQRKLERSAFRLGGGNYAAPIQTVGDFLKGQASQISSLGEVRPSYTGPTTPSDLRQILPSYMTDALTDALPAFGTKIRGFDRQDAILTGVESRSSCPIRIVRDDSGQSNIRGLYPMGEGAGYAGGITSAAIDGIKMVEQYMESQRGSKEG